jgi:hypothetical protein
MLREYDKMTPREQRALVKTGFHMLPDGRVQVKDQLAYNWHLVNDGISKRAMEREREARHEESLMARAAKFHDRQTGRFLFPSGKMVTDEYFDSLPYRSQIDLIKKETEGGSDE